MFSKEQIEFIDQKLTIPSKIYLPFADSFDDKYIMTDGNKWSYQYSGTYRTIIFNGVNPYVDELMKHLAYRYLSSRHAFHVPLLTNSWYNFFKAMSDHPFDLDSCLNYLKESADIVDFWDINFGVKVLCLMGLPNFSYEKYNEEIEFIPRPKQENFHLIYSNADNAIDKATSRLISTQLYRIGMQPLDKLLDITIDDLANLSVLSLCFAVGMRPTQLASLAVADIQKSKQLSKAEPTSCRILVPYTKRLGDKFQKMVIDVPVWVGHIVLGYCQKANKQAEDKLFPVAKSASELYNSMLSQALVCISSLEIQQNIQDGYMAAPHLTVSDFRHNIGHTLAMQGVSAEEIAYIMGHSVLTTAKHYIQATPRLAIVRHEALGKNPVWQNMMAMIVTGSLVKKSEWDGKRVANSIEGKLLYEIGGCEYIDKCPFSMVRSCYGCLYYRPFEDGNHQEVLDCLEKERISLIEISNATGQPNNPLIETSTQMCLEVKSVIKRCQLKQQANGQNNRDV